VREEIDLRAHTAASLRVRTTAVIAAMALGAFALVALGTQSAEAKKHKTPRGLKFFKPPKHLPKQHGKLIRSRKAKGLVPLANARYTKLVLYSSRTPQNARDAVSGSVSVPKGKAPKGGWPVVTYAHGTTGNADICAPTRNRLGSPAQAYISYIDPDLNEWLRAGYAVVRTDYQGLGTPGKHPYLVGEAEGRSVLDIVKAARQLDRHIGKRFLIAGHSQGGHAALFAAGEAKSWVPRLQLRGTVAFAPASHIRDQASLLTVFTTPNALSALVSLIVDGASTQSSAINIPALVNDPFLNLMPLVQSQCLSQLSGSDEFGGIAPSTIVRSGADTTALYAVLEQMNPLVTSRAPILMVQGESDTTVFPLFTDQLKGELIAAGNNLTYKKYPGVDHGGIVTAAEPDALAFFRAQLPPHR
jgi:pimeloyl-ACP methyl ester carboxylesterase